MAIPATHISKHENVRSYGHPSRHKSFCAMRCRSDFDPNLTLEIFLVNSLCLEDILAEARLFGECPIMSMSSLLVDEK